MNLPVHDENAPTRSPAEVRAMAVAVQANLVQLVVAESKRHGRQPAEHDIKAVAPGAVKHFRETLIPPGAIASYTDAELHLRLREIWGRYCTMRWLFAPPDSDLPENLADLSPGAAMQCPTAMAIKEAEVNAFLWKMLFEQRRRADPDFPSAPAFEDRASLAERIPAAAFDRPIEQLSDDELLFASCEHAGMLAVVRWAVEKSADWSDPKLMQVNELNFHAG